MTVCRDDDGEPQRLPNGRFARGSSGNRGGRPRKHRRRHSNAYANARAAIEVAEMPVRMTIDGEVTETSAYSAALRKVYQQAMANNDMRAMKMFLDCIHSATNHLMEHSELVRFLIERDEEEQEAMARILRYFPQSTGTGTYTRLEDSSLVPMKWAESLDRLERLDALEAGLLERERAIAEREARLRQSPGDGAPGKKD